MPAEHSKPDDEIETRGRSANSCLFFIIGCLIRLLKMKMTSRPDAILKRMRGQRTTSNNRRWQRGEAVYAQPKQDVGVIRLLGDADAPHRVQTYLHGFSNLFDPDIYKINRKGIKRDTRIDYPSIERIIYDHEIIQIQDGGVVGNITTRYWKSPGSRGGEWALMKIVYQGEVLYEMEGA
jgi:hypothetical protein